LRTEYNSPPPEHRTDPREVRWQMDWVSRTVPNSGAAFAVNFLIDPADVGPTLRPVRVATVVRHPLARIAAEYFAFRQDVRKRGGADSETRAIAGSILRFTDALKRNNYLTRLYSRVDVCDPLDADAVARARTALGGMDAVGTHENLRAFARKLLSLDIFDGPDRSKARAKLLAETAAKYRGPGDNYFWRLNPWTRRELARQNETDLALYDWIGTASK
jgi:hypothetical protein